MILNSEISNSKKTQRILIVDDDANFLFGVSRTLAKAGFEVIVSSDADSGILQAQNKQPDLIILDVNMPKMNGFEVKHVLDKISITKNIPTVFLSAMNNKAFTLSGLKLAQDYLSKPIDADVLIAKIKAILHTPEYASPLTIKDSIKETFSINHFYELLHASEAHDYGITGHNLRVTYWFIALAKRLGITGVDLENARKGALLHDIGTLAIPGTTLNKPGPLTRDEWLLVREHPEKAVEILKGIPTLAAAMDIPYFHHERWDGMGYPKGLKGETIPLIVRIFSVVDIFDVLHTKRPYKEAVSEKKALEIILSESGKQFDPQIVNYFIKNYRSLEEEVNNASITNNPSGR
jgi:putative two-component system response regulator